MNKVIVITGPTATGKTALGIALAEKIGGEVVGADSMQIYRRMTIGTAKPTPEEMRGVPHHMIDIADPCEDYSAARYGEEAAVCVDDIISRGKMPIIVGGTGLYIDALISGTQFAPGRETGLRDRLSGEYDALGGEAMHERLRAVDPEAALRIHSNDKKRIVRALEVFLSTGMTLSEHDAETKKVPPRYDALRIALTFEDRAMLYERIDRRVDLMMEKGLVDEVRSLLSDGVPRDGTAMQAIGYKEIADALDGRITMDEAVETVKRSSRRYAKRQLSWLGRYDDVRWIRWKKAPTEEEALHISTAFLKNFCDNGAI